MTKILKHRQQIQIELLHDKTNDLGITAITNSGQPGHSPSLESLMNKCKVLSYPLSADSDQTQRTLEFSRSSSNMPTSHGQVNLIHLVSLYVSTLFHLSVNVKI